MELLAIADAAEWKQSEKLQGLLHCPSSTAHATGECLKVFKFLRLRGRQGLCGRGTRHVALAVERVRELHNCVANGSGTCREQLHREGPVPVNTEQGGVRHSHGGLAQLPHRGAPLAAVTPQGLDGEAPIVDVSGDIHCRYVQWRGCGCLASKTQQGTFSCATAHAADTPDEKDLILAQRGGAKEWPDAEQLRHLPERDLLRGCLDIRYSSKGSRAAEDQHGGAGTPER
mmetsp:Transcript_64031/g.202326  ORF Transcript_64031/g.202326 Transcript_64031/m.202326 type:complete len:229 (+) Transcript_64031:491-1177(+)